MSLLCTKIVATLGRRPEVLPAFVQAGIDAIRLNMSHSPDLEKIYNIYKQHADNWQKHDQHIAIIGDLQGPKIRLGQISRADQSAQLVAGERFALCYRDVVDGNEKQASVLYEGKPFNAFADNLSKGQIIWLGDGEVMLTIESIDLEHGRVICHIEHGDTIRQRCGVSVKGMAYALAAFTEKDRVDLLQMLKILGSDLTYVVLSFVCSAQDIIGVKHIIHDYYHQQGLSDKEIDAIAPGVIAKIETQEAVDNIEALIEVSDAIMIGRGDLGMQVGLKEVARIQKIIIKACNVMAKPVIVATQMLASMETNPIPTRAEVSDVFNAILDGTDAVMLSGETAKGLHGVESIKTMREIAYEAEQTFFYGHIAPDPKQRFLRLLEDTAIALPRIQRKIQALYDTLDDIKDPDLKTYTHQYYDCTLKQLEQQHMTNSISHAACNLANDVTVAAIIALTASGSTAAVVSRFRSPVTVIAACHQHNTARRLTLNFGVIPLDITQEYENNNEVFAAICKKLLTMDVRWKTINNETMSVAHQGDKLIITAGFPLYEAGNTNSVQIHKIK